MMPKDMKIYQPIPFPEFDGVKGKRKDCPERYEVIQADYGSFKGKTLYDLCSANCYFGFRFLQDGGKSVTAVELNNATRAFVEGLSAEKGLALKIHRKIKPVSDKHDIGFYLDTHYHEGTTGYIEHIKDLCDVLYTSSSKDSKIYEKDLQKLFGSVKPIYTGYVERVLYKCTEVKS